MKKQDRKNQIDKALFLYYWFLSKKKYMNRQTSIDRDFVYEEIKSEARDRFISTEHFVESVFSGLSNITTGLSKENYLELADMITKRKVIKPNKIRKILKKTLSRTREN